MDKEVIIEDGIKGGGKTYDNFYYDRINEICYVELRRKAFPPLSLSKFDVFQIFFFPYFSRFGESIVVTGNIAQNKILIQTFEITSKDLKKTFLKG